MSSFADANCEMRVNFRCPACKMEMMDVLGSVIGGYSVDIAGSEGLARVRGEVDPNMFLKALSRTGKHAEIARVSLKHPMMSQHYPHPRHRTGYGDDAHLYGPYHHNYYDTSSSSNRRYNDNYKYGYGVYPDQQQYPWYDNASTSYHGGGGRHHHQYRRQFNPMRGTTPCCASAGGGCRGYGPFNGYGLG